MKKKVLSLCLVIALVAIAAVSASLAYFTDTEKATNTFTVGNVDIVQNEQDRTGATYEQEQEIYPLVTPTGTKDESGLYPACENYVDKIVTVTNTGENDVYVRTFIAIPEFDYEGNDPDSAADEVLHWNGYSEGDKAPSFPAATRIPGTTTDVDNHWYWGKQNTSAWPGNGGEWNKFSAEIDGVKYTIMVVTHTEIVEPDETTAPSLLGFYLDSHVDYDNTNGYYTYNGAEIKGLEIGEDVDILVATQAVQTKGFSDAWTALDTAFGVPSATNNPFVG